MYKFNKVAGLILDQQDDPGAGWDEIERFWPDYLEPPTIGQDLEKSACAIPLTDGHQKLAKYPVDTPSNALASSMYFLAFGVDAFDDFESIEKIAHDLQEYRIAHGVSLPEDFVEYLKTGSYEVAPEEIYADDEQNLPVTTPEQAMASIRLFTKKASAWSAADRLLYSAKLQKVADHYGLDVDLPYATNQMSKHASGAIDLRLVLMQQMGDDLHLDEYIEGMEDIKLAMLEADCYDDILKIASEIESLDMEFGMDEAWGVQIPDPVDSLIEGFNPDPFQEVDKVAEVDWGSVDWGGLPFEEGIVDAIKEDPEVIIPTLPSPKRKIVEDHIYGKS